MITQQHFLVPCNCCLFVSCDIYLVPRLVQSLSLTLKFSRRKGIFIPLMNKSRFNCMSIHRILGAAAFQRPLLQRRQFGGSGQWNKYGLTYCRGEHKIAVIGAGGRVGQTLSLFLKTSNRVEDLALYDNCDRVSGIVRDLSNIPTITHLSSHEGKRSIEHALDNASIVVVSAEVPRHAVETSDTELMDVSFISMLFHRGISCN